MEIPISGKNGLYIETPSRSCVAAYSGLDVSQNFLVAWHWKFCIFLKHKTYMYNLEENFSPIHMPD